jgi:hypothetical protein
VQTLYKGGSVLPAKVEDSEADLKVYVNAAGRPVIRKQIVARAPQPSPGNEPPEVQQLKRDLDRLSSVVEQLRKRVVELEKSRRSK